MKLALSLLALLPLTSCVSFGYMRFWAEEPVPAAATQQLHPGNTTLGDSLTVLGAPLAVFEYGDDGMALLWSWVDTLDWGLAFSLPISDQVSASFEMDVTDDRRRGVVLWFGSDLVLERWRRGRVGELLAGRTRPAAVE